MDTSRFLDIACLWENSEFFKRLKISDLIFLKRFLSRRNSIHLDIWVIKNDLSKESLATNTLLAAPEN